MMKYDVYSTRVSVIVDKISVLSNLMIGTGVGADIELSCDELAGLGYVLADVGRELCEWNHKNDKIKAVS